MSRRPALTHVLELFVTAAALNFAWEMAQMRLYVSTGSWIRDSIGCAQASVGDGVMILVIYAAGAAVFRSADWFRRPSATGYVLILAIGLTLAVTFEGISLRSERWAYGPSMPRLPGPWDLGVLPIVQMMVLPAIVFWIVSALDRTRSVSSQRRSDE